MQNFLNKLNTYRSLYTHRESKHALDYSHKPGSVKAKGREPKSCLGQVFSVTFKANIVNNVLDLSSTKSVFY